MRPRRRSACRVSTSCASTRQLRHLTMRASSVVPRLSCHPTRPSTLTRPRRRRPSCVHASPLPRAPLCTRRIRGPWIGHAPVRRPSRRRQTSRRPSHGPRRIWIAQTHPSFRMRPRCGLACLTPIRSRRRFSPFISCVVRPRRGRVRRRT